LSSNIGEVLTVFILSLFGYLPLTAVQLLWINLLTDGFPALALGADPSPKDIMKKKPLKKGEGIINRDLMVNMVFVGVVLTVLVSLLFFIGLNTSKEMAMTLVFTGFVVYELLRIIIIRTNERMPLFNNKLLVFAVMLSLGLQLIVLYTPLNKFFNVVPLHWIQWLWILGLGIAGTGFILFFTKVLQRDKEELE
jgi:Ca2+-transporting ATPase